MIYFWEDPQAGERQSIGIEFWRAHTTGEIFGLCREFDIVWTPFLAAIEGEPGKVRPPTWNWVPDETIRPATRNEIAAAGLLPYVTNSFEDPLAP